MKSVVVVGAQWGDEGKGKVWITLRDRLTILRAWRVGIMRGIPSLLGRIGMCCS